MGLGGCCRLILGRLPLKAYVNKEGSQSVDSSHGVNPGALLRNNSRWSHQLLLFCRAGSHGRAGGGLLGAGVLPAGDKLSV